MHICIIFPHEDIPKTLVLYTAFFSHSYHLFLPGNTCFFRTLNKRRVVVVLIDYIVHNGLKSLWMHNITIKSVNILLILGDMGSNDLQSINIRHKRIVPGQRCLQ